MNRINQLFQEKKSNILSIYYCAGSPKLDDTVPVLRVLQEGGIDMVEIGVPFSDPMADGPVIQQASTKALKNGMSLRLLFEQLKDVRKEIHIPLLMMGYLNVFYQFGFERFCQKCAEVGIDGAIIPDLPFDIYIKRYKSIADRYDLRIIMLITPETEAERIRLIDENTDGFIYEVSTDATTGAQNSFGPATIEYFQRIRDMHLKNPTLVGFGVSNKATREATCTYTQGSIIGSKFVRLLDESGDPAKAVSALKDALTR